MRVTTQPERLPTVTSENAGETRGQALRRRIEERGMRLKDFVQESGRSLRTLQRAFEDDPTITESTWRALEAKIQQIERENGALDGHGNVAAERLVEVEMDGVYGVERVVVRAPAGDIESLTAAVKAIMEQVRDTDRVTVEQPR